MWLRREKGKEKKIEEKRKEDENGRRRRLKVMAVLTHICTKWLY
jgi:hypothetical protein